MDKNDLLQLFDSFINEHGLVTAFNAFIEEKGYTQDEYDEVMDETNY